MNLGGSMSVLFGSNCHTVSILEISKLICIYKSSKNLTGARKINPTEEKYQSFVSKSTLRNHWKAWGADFLINPLKSFISLELMTLTLRWRRQNGIDSFGEEATLNCLITKTSHACLISYHAIVIYGATCCRNQENYSTDQSTIFFYSQENIHIFPFIVHLYIRSYLPSVTRTKRREFIRNTVKLLAFQDWNKNFVPGNQNSSQTQMNTKTWILEEYMDSVKSWTLSLLEGV